MVIPTTLAVVRMVAIVATALSAVPGVEGHDFLGGAPLDRRQEIRRPGGLRHRGRGRGPTAGNHLERRRRRMKGRSPGHVAVACRTANDQEAREQKPGQFKRPSRSRNQDLGIVVGGALVRKIGEINAHSISLQTQMIQSPPPITQCDGQRRTGQWRYRSKLTGRSH